MDTGQGKKQVLDEKAAIREAELRLKEAIKQGKEEGIEQGIEQGKKWSRTQSFDY